MDPGSTGSCTAPALGSRRVAEQGGSPGEPKLQQMINSPALPSRNLISASIQSNPKPQSSGPRIPSRSIQAQIQTSRAPSSSSSCSTIPTPGVLCWQSRDPPCILCPESGHLPRSRGCSFPSEGAAENSNILPRAIVESWSVNLSSHQPFALPLKPLIASCHTAGPRGTAEIKQRAFPAPGKAPGALKTQCLQLLPCPGQAPQGVEH